MEKKKKEEKNSLNSLDKLFMICISLLIKDNEDLKDKVLSLETRYRSLERRLNSMEFDYED